MDTHPLVSVLMTAYNREKFIAEAIESVLASTYSNFELIIVDDDSSDSTVSIAKIFEEKDDRINVYVNEKNLGDYPNRNRAASFAKGEYLMHVDSDDKITKNGIESCVESMVRFPEASFGIYCPGNTSSLINSENGIKKHFFESPFLIRGPGGTIIRRDFFESINKYPEKYGPANDMYFNLKAACFSPTVLLSFEFVLYRIHDGQELNNRYSYLINNYRYLRDALLELPLPLDKKEITWLEKKNKRRFTVNIFKYLFSTFNLGKTVNAIKQANFSSTDALSGIFH